MTVVLNTASLIALAAVRDIRKTSTEMVEKLTEKYRIPEPAFVLDIEMQPDDSEKRRREREQQEPKQSQDRGSIFSLLA